MAIALLVNEPRGSSHAIPSESLPGSVAADAIRCIPLNHKSLRKHDSPSCRCRADDDYETIGQRGTLIGGCLWPPNGSSNTGRAKPLVVDAGPDVVTEIGVAVELAASVTGGDGNYSYQWSPSDGLDDPVALQPNGLTDGEHGLHLDRHR